MMRTANLSALTSVRLKSISLLYIGDASLKQFHNMACRTPGCNFIGVDRFAGHCCFLCQKGTGTHGWWCPGTKGADPGPHPFELDQRIEEIRKQMVENNAKLLQLEAGFKTTCIILGVAGASLLVHKFFKS